MPKISVVIPVYNGEKTIQETIESVLAQTFTDFELIIIDDGSSDRTVEIIEEIIKKSIKENLDQRIRLYSFTNKGLSATRNRGIRRSSGDYIAFLDADDLWTPDKLASQYLALQNTPTAAVAYSGTSRIDEHSKILYDVPLANLRGNLYDYLLLRDIVGSGSNPLIERQALDEIGDFDESLWAAEDWDMWIKLSSKYEFIDVPLHQILYRQSPRSMSNKIGRQERETLKVINNAFAQAPTTLQYLKRYSLINVYICLTFKCLEESPNQQKGRKGIRLFIKLIIIALTSHIVILRRRITWKVFLRLIIVAIFPSKYVVKILNRWHQLYDLSSFFGNMINHP
ncbi:MAG: glycosyltransferase [Coleofasciculaceae cyanobacterium SM2_1_6]|nr:glycosyltransferase [Coleofasciculaceae cyanobacterium SM2_1_6]